MRIPHFGNVEDGRITAMRYFIDRGMTPYAAAGLVGNLYRESNLVPDSVNSSSGAYGIAQWLGDRKKNLFARYGNKPTLEQQLDYVLYELDNTHKKGRTMLNQSQSVDDAAINGFGYYEFMAGPKGAIKAMNDSGQNGQASMEEGIRNANAIWNLYAPIMRRELNQREAKFGKVPVENASQRMSVTVKPVAPRLTPPAVQLPVIKPKTENNNTALRKTLFSEMMLAAGLTDLFNL